MSTMVVTCARTSHGRFREYLYPDQTAELGDDQGRLLSGREPLYRIGQALAELNIDPSDLVYG
jgi:hypothetical protein